MVSFGDRIRELADRLGKEEQDIAKDLNLTKSQLSHYINGRRKVPSNLLQKIVDRYNINPQFLFRENASLYNVAKEEQSSYTIKEKQPIYKEKNEYHYMPTSISAGLPIDVEAVTNAETVQIPDSVMGKWAGDKEIFFSKINGDSMDRIIPDKSLIAIKPIEKETLKNGDIVVFSNDHDYSVKYFYKQSDKLIFKPHSYSREHHEQHYNFTDNITIHGKVVLYIVELD